MNKKIFLVFLLVFLIFTITGCGSKKSQENAEAQTQETKTKENWTLPKPSMMIDQNKNYTALLSTNKGVITVELDAKHTPITVNNFVYLARNRFYDGTFFHRTINGFMIQGGDPKGDGTGGPGYSFDDEPFEGRCIRGAVAMANAGPNTNGSQFFIMQNDNPLPKNYVIFGKVTDGMEVVDLIAQAPVRPQVNGEVSRPVTPVIVENVMIIEK